MKLDIDALHKHFKPGMFHPRRSGKTTAMLVCAIQQADFKKSTTIVLLPYLRDIFWIIPQTLELADALDFPAYRPKKDTLHILGEAGISVIQFQQSDRSKCFEPSRIKDSLWIIDDELDS